MSSRSKTCEGWFHYGCQNIDDSDAKAWRKTTLGFICIQCRCDDAGQLDFLMGIGRLSQVLNLFKKLHRTSQTVFNGDQEALSAARCKINQEFRKHVRVQQPDKIEELIGAADEAEVYLRTQVIQLQQKDPGVYKAKIREGNLQQDNSIPPKKERKRRKQPNDSPT